MGHLGGRSFVRFLLVGGSATALHYMIMAALLGSGWLAAEQASATGYCLSTLYNYWANAHFTFSGNHDHRRSLPRFLVTAAAGLGINQLILRGGLALSLPVALAQVLATGCVLLWNYFVNAIWSFRTRSTQ